MKIEVRDIAAVVPYARNPRKNEAAVAKVAASLQEFGWRQPIVVDSKGGVIAGHTRLQAAQHLAMARVPVHIATELTAAQVAAYRLADNRTAEEAEWDSELLKIELKDLLSQDFDLELTGFDNDELSDILEEVSEGLTDDDAVPDLPDEPITQPGDLWLLGRHRLLCGDSTDDNDVARLMDGEKADMVFTDPPWNVNYGADQNHPSWKPRTILNDFMGTEDFKDFMSAAFAQLNKSSKNGCPTYVVMSAQEWGNAMLTLALNNYHWSSTIIWNKSHLVLSRKDYHTKYEPIWYGWSEGEARLCPVKDRKQCDVWDIDRPSRSDLHPITKPVELVERAIQNSSKRDNRVLDLFCGSGSTLIACEKTSRSCYSMELDPKYCDVIIERWQAFTDSEATCEGENYAGRQAKGQT